MAPVMWVELEAILAFVLVGRREDAFEPLLVVSAIVEIVRWRGKEVAGLPIHWVRYGSEEDEAVAVGRPAG